MEKNCPPRAWLGDDIERTPDQKALDRFSVHGRTAVIIGGGRGMGLESAYALLEHGLKRLLIIDNDGTQHTRGSDACKSLKRVFPDRDIQYDIVDIGNQARVAEWFRNSGRVVYPDIVLAFAGAVVVKSIEQHTLADLENVLRVNVIGTFHAIKLFGECMIKNKVRGAVVVMASLAGHRVTEEPSSNLAYSASKAAVLSMVRSFATEWACHGIRVNSISPGFMYSALQDGADEDTVPEEWYRSTPMKRIGQKGEIDGAVMLLASDAGSYITGTDIVVDGGRLAHM